MKNKIIMLSFITIFLFFGCGGGSQTIELYLQSDENTNGGNAVVVTLYQLRNADIFRLSDFQALTRNPETTLGADLIPNSKFERTMVPGDTLELGELELKPEAAFLGVIADFHSPAADGWQQLIPLNTDFDRLIVSVHEKSLSVKIED